MKPLNRKALIAKYEKVPDAPVDLWTASDLRDWVGRQGLHNSMAWRETDYLLNLDRGYPGSLADVCQSSVIGYVRKPTTRKGRDHAWSRDWLKLLFALVSELIESVEGDARVLPGATEKILVVLRRHLESAA